MATTVPVPAPVQEETVDDGRNRNFRWGGAAARPRTMRPSSDLQRRRPMPGLSPDTRDKLKTVSTATLCTALYKRGLRNQFIQDVRPLNPQAGPMVGEAFTLRYIPAREDLNPLSVFQDR